MELFTFVPAVDVPLSLVTLIAVLVNFQYWAHENALEFNVDLKSRLPQARLRIVLFFIAILAGCCVIDLAVWSIYAVSLVAGLVIGTFSGNGPVPEATFFLAVLILREWCFGFPQLILHPPIALDPTKQAEKNREFIGLKGISTSALRPSGYVQIDGSEVEEMSAISEDSTYIESGTRVVVVAVRNGNAFVRVVTDNPDEQRSPTVGD